eukprot:TRINITY_DN10797_c0_g1_i3.p3 TRINITY_DN10797_c0_g1~~TRINITY_DN10797_c0_g1_i3.p3  ORF type:complete len:103 (+),score=7.55 TRINITY_DN10797_c0_g1_i3:133-441(+)
MQSILNMLVMQIGKNQFKLLQFGYNTFRCQQCRSFSQQATVVPFYNTKQAIYEEGKVWEKDFFIPNELNLAEMLYDRIKTSWYLAQLEMLTRHYKSNMEIRL